MFRKKAEKGSNDEKNKKFCSRDVKKTIYVIICGLIPIVCFQIGVFFGESGSNSYISTLTKSSSCLSGGINVESEISNSDEYSLAREDSYGFFLDIPNHDWMLHKKRTADIQPNTCNYCRGAGRPNAWFQNHYEPEFACRHERRIGRLGDGGKWVCDPHRIAESTNCLIYSVGSNNDFSFEQAIFDDIGKHCEIHTFDPDDYSVRAKETGVHYHQWGIDAMESIKGARVYKTLNQTVHELGHVGRTIDIFKIDCEGCELRSFGTWVNSTQLRGTVLRQVLVEIHADDASIREGTEEFFVGMHNNDYVMFHKEPNIHYWKFGPAIEFAFLKLSHAFFE